MTRLILDLRHPSPDLPPLDFQLSDTDQAIARQIRASLEQQRQGDDHVVND